MSAILGVFDPDGELPDDAGVERMLSAIARRGADHSAVWRDDAAVLAVSRFEWELEAGFSGPHLLVEDADLVIAADASLYYRDELKRQLAERGVVPRSDAPAHLIGAAYRAWGPRCAEHLEGDFAFVVWDRTERRACCARDFSGRRPLFYGEGGGALVVASAIGAVVAHHKVSDELNLAAVGALAAGLFASGHETCRRSVSDVPAGSTLVGTRRTHRLEAHWTPPRIGTNRETLPFDEAAGELRRLLSKAVEERLAPAGPTSVWLSGGWDSPSVFGIGEDVLRGRGAGEHLHAVSISYPPGDPGREDELIEAILGHWGSPVTWIQSTDIPLLDRPEARAAARDEPFAHAFEMWNRALARGARAAGSRVAFEGNGGDQFFGVSNIYLADLFRTGRWRELKREWTTLGGSGFRYFFRNAVQPNLSGFALHAARLLRGGRPLRGYVERTLPPWMNPAFVASTGLEERERRNTPRRRFRDHAAQEMYWYLAHEYSPRIISTVAGLALEEGVEDRSPLYDPRVIAFAASRPRWERASGPETKRLLRRALSDLLPGHVLAPRTARTGTTFGYFTREIKQKQAAFLIRTFDAPMLLEELGMVDAVRIRASCARYLRGGNTDEGGNLLYTLQAELWLQQHSGRSSVGGQLPSSSQPVGSTAR
jgi:asparagine synthase (glutamine-hydrolysing)